MFCPTRFLLYQWIRRNFHRSRIVILEFYLNIYIHMRTNVTACALRKNQKVLEINKKIYIFLNWYRCVYSTVKLKTVYISSSHFHLIPCNIFNFSHFYRFRVFSNPAELATEILRLCNQTTVVVDSVAKILVRIHVGFRVKSFFFLEIFALFIVLSYGRCFRILQVCVCRSVWMGNAEEKWMCANERRNENDRKCALLV